MNPMEVERFFKGVARDFKGRAGIYLTGAAAGSTMGSIRPSMDIDFAVSLKSRDPRHWAEFESAVEKNRRLTGIQTNYSEDIDRWSQVTYLDYRKHCRPFKTFGGIQVRVLNPEYWSIGKMTRYIDLDVKDMVAVFRKQRTPAGRLAGLWGKALRLSPKSSALMLFRRQVENFLGSYGRDIWGKGFSAAKVLDVFYRSAGIRLPKSKD